MQKVHDILVIVRNQELSQFGINLEYSGTLNLVVTLGNKATPSEIARWRYRRPHTVSKVLGIMEKEGLVERKHDSKRHNVIRVSPTKKGLAAFESSKQTSLKMKEIFSCLTRQKLKKLVYYLEKIRSRAIESFAIDYDTKPLYEKFVDGELEYIFWRVLRRTNDIVIRILEKELRSDGFSVEMGSMLISISLLGRQATPRDIALMRHRSANNISTFLKNMEVKGLLQKHYNLRKKNQVLVTLTPKGERYLRKVIKVQSIKQLFTDFSVKELREFNELFTRIQMRAIQKLVT
jgi:DNA-binding MarR family transcriptional regulator